MDLQALVSTRPAQSETRVYCLYMFYFQGLSRTQLSKLFNKSISTISNWIERFEQNDTVSRVQTAQVRKKFGDGKVEWILELFKEKPLLYLDEAQDLFRRQFSQSISASHISNILHGANLTKKMIERRAIQIQERDILRFTEELLKIPHLLSNLVMLDEVSFDNRSMFRRRGWALKGTRLYYRGEYCRKPRVSCLCFIGVEGLLETYMTDGTFTRSKFASNCRDFALNSGQVQRFPGEHSLWILDGALIHLDSDLPYYLRSLGIIVIFLPAYCPFFNPIELMFGAVKGRMTRYYSEETTTKDLELFVAQVLSSYRGTCFASLYRKCGYSANGFNPGRAVSNVVRDDGYQERRGN